MFKSVCPILPSSNFAQTKGFYLSLGFKVAHEYVEEGYLILVRDTIEIHFFESPEHIAEASDHGAYIRVENANMLSGEYEKLNLAKDGIPRFIKAEDKAWEVCELVIVDIDGNLLRMGHGLNTKDTRS